MTYEKKLLKSEKKTEKESTSKKGAGEKVLYRRLCFSLIKQESPTEGHREYTDEKPPDRKLQQLKEYRKRNKSEVVPTPELIMKLSLDSKNLEYLLKSGNLSPFVHVSNILTSFGAFVIPGLKELTARKVRRFVR
ncbi:hypothetical protein AVEN_117079-1 [Araneus ventricosus]|uniref:Uncharacterized protein n=1 Tax=Araneus ventricosus TaxID=182803 RepID=A0A4Y2REE1_ARAVE|nr:hypothetical protein AVEN_117079-1 [Araneus ventricosus]